MGGPGYSVGSRADSSTSSVANSPMGVVADEAVTGASPADEAATDLDVRTGGANGLANPEQEVAELPVLKGRTL